MAQDKVKIGIIGGMGPEATLDLFRKILRNTPANKDQDHLHLIIDNNTSIPDRTDYILGKGENPLPFILESDTPFGISRSKCYLYGLQHCSHF